MLRKWSITITFGALLILCGIGSAQAPQSDFAVVAYNGVEFRYLPDVFGAVLPYYDEGTPFQTDAPYFANVAPHTTFHFLRPAPEHPDTNWDGELRVYRIADLEAYAEMSYRDVVERLKSLNLADLSDYATVNPDYRTPALPFMPVLNATQVFRAHPRALAFDSVAGIEYYTYFSQAAEPILEGQVMYTYQGITADGLYYLSFSMPVQMGLLQTAIPQDFDWEAFVANYPTYLQDVYATISSADPESFVPTHAALNTFIDSILVAG